MKKYFLPLLVIFALSGCGKSKKSVKDLHAFGEVKFGSRQEDAIQKILDMQKIWWESGEFLGVSDSTSVFVPLGTIRVDLTDFNTDELPKRVYEGLFYFGDNDRLWKISLSSGQQATAEAALNDVKRAPLFAHPTSPTRTWPGPYTDSGQKVEYYEIGAKKVLYTIDVEPGSDKPYTAHVVSEYDLQATF